MSRARHHQALPEGYSLHWYRIDSILGQGGFGITYLARDTNLDQPVAIKEFLPKELATRSDDSHVHPVSEEQAGTYSWGMERFLKEARTLAQFKHPNIVQVYAVFEANNTAYMVMEYEHGRSLADALRFRQIEGEATMLSILEPILDGLEKIHGEGFIHRDIKPDNIYLREDGSPVLLDFGSARQALGPGTRTLTALVSPGFAPFEQYDNTSDGESKQGPWTDVYALAATLYCAIAGKGPPDAIARANAVMSGADILVPAVEVGAGRYSHALLEAIDQGLAFHGRDRPQSIAQWRAMLRGELFHEADTALAPGTAMPTAVPGTASVRRPPADPGVTAGAGAATGWELEALDRPATEVPAAPSTGSPEQEPAPEPAPAPARAPGPAPRRAGGLGLYAGLAAAVLVGAGGAWYVLGARQAGETQSPVAGAPVAPVSVAPMPPEPSPPLETASAPAPDPGRRAGASERAIEVTALVAAGRLALDQMRLASPPGNNAVEYFGNALKVDPDNAEAVAGLRSIAEQLVSIAERAERRDDRAMAREYLDKAEAVFPDSELVRGARGRLLGEGVAAYRPELPAGVSLSSSPAPATSASGGAFRDCPTCPELVAIPVGRFTMGDDGDAGLPAYVSPAHAVTITRPFAIGVHEVTFDEWDACVADGGCGYQPADSGWGRGARPVVDVSFDHVRQFLRWLGGKSGFDYRLPSEAEWEYVARGGEGFGYPWGLEAALGQANCWNCNDAGPAEKTMPVGSYAPNPLGVRDLGGNVWEWVEDCWNGTFDGAPGDGAAWVDGNCRLRVIRGGSWMNQMSTLQAANRGKMGATVKRNFVGFRVARDL